MQFLQIKLDANNNDAVDTTTVKAMKQCAPTTSTSTTVFQNRGNEDDGYQSHGNGDILGDDDDDIDLEEKEVDNDEWGVTYFNDEDDMP